MSRIKKTGRTLSLTEQEAQALYLSTSATIIGLNRRIDETKDQPDVMRSMIRHRSYLNGVLVKMGFGIVPTTMTSLSPSRPSVSTSPGPASSPSGPSS